MLKRFLLSLCCLAAAADGAAQTAGAAAPGPGSLQTLRVPGGVAALLKTAGLDDTLPRTRALRDVIHVVYDTPEGVNDAIDTRRRTVLTYLESISAVEALSAGRGQAAAPSLRRAEDRTVRRQLEAIARAIGCTLEREPRGYRLQPEQGERQDRRRADLVLAGLDLDGLLAAANAGQPVSISLRGDDVPQPLSQEAWKPLIRVSEKLSGSLFTSILGDRRSALLYFGLISTDAGTRDFLQRNPAVLKEILESDRVAVLAGYGQGIRVAGGRVVVPGGTSAEPLWQDLAGESVSRPDRFIARLLEKDRGRLASLFDTAYSLDSRRLAFLLGSSITDPEARRERLARLYDAYGSLLLSWDPAARPFVRTLYDGAHVLAMTSVDAMGRVSGPPWVRLWRRAFDGIDIPADPAGDLGNFESDGYVDAAWLLRTLGDTDRSFALRRNRTETWLFGQRVFAGAPPASLPDQLVTLRAFPRFRVLLWTLERMGITDPKLYASAAVLADRLSRIGGSDRAATALALFQGSVALIERARAARTLDAQSAGALVRSLVAVPVNDSGEYLGGIGRWMTASLLPAFGERIPPRPQPGTPTVEETVLRAMAGRALSTADSPNLELTLEGLLYRVDLAGAELSRMQAVREKQRGVPLDVALALGDAAAAVAAPGTSLDALPDLAADLDHAAQAVLAISGRHAPWLDQGEFRKTLASVSTDVGRIRKPKDLPKLERIAEPFLAVADRLQAQATMSLVYTAVLRDPENTALLDGDPAARHDWGFSEPTDQTSQPTAWREPVPDRTGGWHLMGSLLGADLALACESLRRVSIDRFPSPPTFSGSDEQTAAESVALIVPFEQSDADREFVTSALQRGRRRMEDVVRSPASWPDAADAMHVRDVRRELVAWALANEPGAVDVMLSLSELVLLGTPPGSSAAHLDSWGISGRSYDGRWSLLYPAPLMFDLLSGRKGGMLTVGLVPDLVLSVAEAMRERQVPAVLTRSILECAARDLIDEVQLQYFDDWVTLIGHARMVPGRLDEYLASLTAGGPLVPVTR